MNQPIDQSSAPLAAAPHAKPRIGLALGAGGARGAAHIGVLRQLTALGIEVDYVAGTSAGALVGSAWLAGQLDLLADLVTHLDWLAAVKLFLENRYARQRKIAVSGLQRFLLNLLQVRSFEELSAPLAVVATDLEGRHEVVFSEGPLTPAIRASIAIPGVFAPVVCEARQLVDGALINPLPVNVLRSMGASHIIAVDVNLRSGLGAPETLPSVATAAPAATAPLDRLLDELRHHWPALARTLPPHSESRAAQPPRRRRSRSALEVWTLATRIAENEITRNRLLLDPPDILIQPAVGDIPTLDPSYSAAAIRAGAEAVTNLRPALVQLFGLDSTP